jgi:hypothetical protein
MPTQNMLLAMRNYMGCYPQELFFRFTDLGQQICQPSSAYLLTMVGKGEGTFIVLE